MNKSQNISSKIKAAEQHLYAGRLSESASILESVLSEAPNNLAAADKLAYIALQRRDYNNAIKILQSLIDIYPNNHELYNKVAVAYALNQKFVQSAAYLRKTIELKPDHYPAYMDLCKVTRETGQLDESIQAGCEAVRLKPAEAKAHSSLGMSYEQFGLHTKAREHYEKAAKLSPNDPNLQFACALGCMGAGDKDAAKKYLERVHSLQPNHAQAYWMKSRLNKYTTENQKDIVSVNALLQNGDVTDDERIYLHFSIGKMYEDCKLYDDAFKHYHEGNQIVNSKINYSPEAYHDYVGRLIRCFSKDFITHTSVYGNPSSKPLFIIGLPRSGTTLIEQIVSSHSKVHGVGELPWFANIEPHLPAATQSSEPYPECVKEITSDLIRNLAQKYLDYLSILSEKSDCLYIADKTLDNYECIGLISILFPNARIIHCQRDPMDNAVSMYNLVFPNAVEYSYDLFNLGTHYTQYQRLMDHWRRLMPQRIFDIKYEDLVQDQEHWTRKLLQFLDLDWDPSCIRFYESDRTVRTYSDFQVRKPIYSSSIGRWKVYEKHLDPLQRGLNWSSIEGCKQ